MGWWSLNFSPLVSFSWYLSIFQREVFQELSGRANAFDYHSEDGWGNIQTSGNGDVGHNQSEYGEFVWSDLDPYAAFIYGFGDLNCHTKAERSWEVNGNQMPVCVRDVGIFLELR